MRNDTTAARTDKVAGEDHGTQTTATGGAKPTLLGVMTDWEVYDALLKRIKAMKPENRRRLLVDLGTGDCCSTH